MANIEIITDGSCRANKNGGIGVVWVINNKIVKEYSKGFKNTTNNIMELKAIYAALISIKSNIESLKIISDSEYSIGVLTNSSWRPKKNIELISKIKKQIIETQKLIKKPIIWIHIRGHGKSDSEYNKYNDLADKLATEASLLL